MPINRINLEWKYIADTPGSFSAHLYLVGRTSVCRQNLLDRRVDKLRWYSVSRRVCMLMLSCGQPPLLSP